MKKLVSILVVTALLITAFVLPVNATDIDYMFGDVDMDGELSVIDTTAILRHCAKTSELEHIGLALADFDNDKAVSVIDATYIQMFISKLVEHPRNNEWLEYYAEIDDIEIGTSGNKLPLVNRSMIFTPVFDEVYNTTGDKKIKVEYVFNGITDTTYSEEYSKELYNDNFSISMSFPTAGLYEVTVKVWKQYENGTYTFTKQFEVLPAIEFDGLRFVNCDYGYKSVAPPEAATDVDYEVVLNAQSMFLSNKYGGALMSERYVALIHTKYEYDRFFGIDNTVFDDEFFENKSLVVAVSTGTEYYDEYPLSKIKIKDDTLYVGVSYRNTSPYENMELPMCPTWYSFASVDKADVMNIKTVQRF